MKKTLIHCRWMVMELLRQPAYVVATLGFPSIFYLIFAVPESKTEFGANLLLGSFSSFAVFGVVFLQLGVGVAQERNQTWYLYLRTLPVTSLTFFSARFLSSLVFSIFAAATIVILALTLTPAHLKPEIWLKYIFTLSLGAASFSTMGLALGYWAGEKSCLPLGNLIYLPMTFAGGLWKPPEALPEVVQDVSVYLPTRHYGELVWAVLLEKDLEFKYAAYLAASFVFFAIVATIGYRRDQSRRFS